MGRCSVSWGEQCANAIDTGSEASVVEVPRGLLPEGFYAVALKVREGYPLHPDEERAVQRAGPQRRREFATGRACVRQALASLGLPYTAVPVGRDRAPLWPMGIIGSVSHSRTLAVAVVSDRTSVRAVGIDIEPAVPLDPDLWPLLAAPGEAPLPIERALGEGLRFSCKEAAFKCWFAAGGDRLLEFCDVRLQVVGDRFIAFAPEPGPSRMDGRWTLDHGHWWSAAWIS